MNYYMFARNIDDKTTDDTGSINSSLKNLSQTRHFEIRMRWNPNEAKRKLIHSSPTRKKGFGG